MSHKMISHAITAILALNLTGGYTNAMAESNPSQDMANSMGHIKGMEKCYGIAKANQNSCATANHGCSGESKVDGDKQAWIMVPKGLCNKIVGGQTKAPTES